MSGAKSRTFVECAERWEVDIVLDEVDEPGYSVLRAQESSVTATG